VIRDFFHRYTVDEHTLVTMQNLRKLPAGYSELLAEVKQPSVVMFALLFHDVGKGVSGEGRWMPPCGWRETPWRASGCRRRTAKPRCFLIRKHLELSQVMQSRDLFDPQTIRDVAHQMETVERLKALTLVTYADISAVNPEVMTPWRAEQLWQLYLAVYNELTRELETERIEAIPSGPPERVAFLEGFPTRYLRTHTEQEIDEQHGARRKRPVRGTLRGVAVDIRKLESAWQLTLVAADRPFLFASVAGTLSSFGMNILKAEAFANRRGLVLDTFTFDDPLRTLELNPTEADRLRATTERCWRARRMFASCCATGPSPRCQPQSAHPAESHSIRRPATRRRWWRSWPKTAPACSTTWPRAISSNGGNIEVVLIDTQAHKAIDVFYVTAEGRSSAPRSNSSSPPRSRRPA